MLAAKDAVEGKTYLSKTGMKVKAIGSKGGKIIMKSETTGHEIRVNPDYELKEAKETKQTSQDPKPAAKKAKVRESKAEKSSKKAGKATLASVIDPMLFEGKMTVNEIVSALEKTGSFKDKDSASLNANIRARMVNYARKGYQIDKGADKKVKVTKIGS